MKNKKRQTWKVMYPRYLRNKPDLIKKTFIAGLVVGDIINLNMENKYFIVYPSKHFLVENTGIFIPVREIENKDSELKDGIIKSLPGVCQIQTFECNEKISIKGKTKFITIEDIKWIGDEIKAHSDDKTKEQI